jgi:5-methylcytosine-specific restriction endonuclease McrA
VARIGKRSGSRNWKAGSTPAWKRLRMTVLLRDSYVCQLQLPGCTGRATSAHHVLGRGVTGDDVAHIVAACRNCNQAVGDPSRADPPHSGRGTRW